MEPGLWLELLVRSAVVLACGELLLLPLRRARPELRHRFILLVFLGLFALPVLSIVVPQVMLPSWHRDVALRAFVTATEISSQVRHGSTHHRTDWWLLCWAAGAVMTALPFVVGHMSMIRVLRRAEPFTDGVWLSADIAVPLTFGLATPRILLPITARDWSSATLDAVLRHERAHIRRRDLLTHAAAQLIACLWWFQPLIWFLLRRLRAESELACDRQVVESGFRASDYAGELLSVARSAVTFRVPKSSIAMLQSRFLERRVHSVLYPSTAAVSTKRVYSLCLALAVAAIAASSVTAARTSPDQISGVTMKRAFSSALLSFAAASAATVSGTVHDVNGLAVPDASVTLTNAESPSQLQATTDSNGKFSLSGKGAGDYILRISKSGYNSVYYEFSLNALSDISDEFIMPVEGSPEPDTPLGSKPILVGGSVAQNNLIKKVNPTYPVAAKQNRVQGTVQIRALISKDGVPQELKIISSPNDELSESALQAVRQWRYRPTLLNGNPVEISTIIVVNYTLMP